jgi:hypothetical protein
VPISHQQHRIRTKESCLICASPLRMQLSHTKVCCGTASVQTSATSGDRAERVIRCIVALEAG